MNRLNITKKSKLLALCVDSTNEKIPKREMYCDILALKFDENIEKSKVFLKNILPQIDKPLMICGYGKEDIDCELLPQLIKILYRECIISFATEKTYSKIIPQAIKGNHYVVLKTPIDINLAKELNILAIEMGLNRDKIIMNTDIGGLGYGYEYGYSIMEKIIQEAQKGDEYVDFPLISEAPLESLKTKEAKSDKISQHWGELNKRASMIEITSASGVLAAGANIIVMKNSDNLKFVRELI